MNTDLLPYGGMIDKHGIVREGYDERMRESMPWKKPKRKSRNAKRAKRKADLLYNSRKKL